MLSDDKDTRTAAAQQFAQDEGVGAKPTIKLISVLTGEDAYETKKGKSEHETLGSSGSDYYKRLVN